MRRWSAASGGRLAEVDGRGDAGRAGHRRPHHLADRLGAPGGACARWPATSGRCRSSTPRTCPASSRRGPARWVRTSGPAPGTSGASRRAAPAPCGCAEPERDAIEPLTTSWNHGMPFPVPFDTYGTDDYTGWFSLAAAIAFWERGGRLAGSASAASSCSTRARLRWRRRCPRSTRRRPGHRRLACGWSACPTGCRPPGVGRRALRALSAPRPGGAGDAVPRPWLGPALRRRLQRTRTTTNASPRSSPPSSVETCPGRS